MGRGFAISAVAHVVALLGVLGVLAGPKPFAPTAVDSIAVDIVDPAEIPAGSSPPVEDAPDPSGGSPEQDREEEKIDRASRETPAQAALPGADPAPDRGADPSDASAAPAEPQGERPQSSEQPHQQSIFDPSQIPQLLDLTPQVGQSGVATGPGVDAPAEERADLTQDEVAQLKSHLRKCWRLPAGMQSTQRAHVIMRLFLARNGTLAAEPELVEVSRLAGPPLVEAARQALRQCQPFGFLPRERYDEWKVLDVRISPREMAGG